MFPLTVPSQIAPEVNPIQALFACAHYHKISLSEASLKLGVGKEDLKEAVRYRLFVSDLGYEYDSDYQRTLVEGMRRLSNAN